MGCRTTTIKVSSIVLNVILAFLGIGSIVWVALNPEALNTEYAISAYVACALVVIFAILGCFAAIRESICLAATCAVFLLVLAILQIVATCMNMDDHKSRSGAATVEKAWNLNAMDGLQADHDCCGKTSPQDYVYINKLIPPSCYVDLNINDANGLHLDGCITKVQEYYDSEHLRLTIVSWLLVAVELLAFLCALFLVINFRNKQRRMQF